jgi:hypothetical protein
VSESPDDLKRFSSIPFNFPGDGQKMVKKEGENNVAEAGEKMETEAK